MDLTGVAAGRRELLADLRRVQSKQAILFRLAGVALEHPDDTVRAALYPAVGVATLRELVNEAAATETAFRGRVRTVLHSSYSAYFRKMLPRPASHRATYASPRGDLPRVLRCRRPEIGLRT